MTKHSTIYRFVAGIHKIKSKVSHSRLQSSRTQFPRSSSSSLLYTSTGNCTVSRQCAADRFGNTIWIRSLWLDSDYNNGACWKVVLVVVVAALIRRAGVVNISSELLDQNIEFVQEPTDGNLLMDVCTKFPNCVANSTVMPVSVVRASHIYSASIVSEINVMV